MVDKAALTPLDSTDADCFACGTENPCGLHMTFYTDGQALYSFVTIPGQMRGWRNMVHGGIISTMLDEAMAWTAIHLLRRFILTQSMQVEFLKPVTIETPLLVKGWIKERVSRRRAVMASAVSDQRDMVLARAEGNFALFKPDSPALQRLLPQGAAQGMPWASAKDLDSAD